jgi:hypothetical protein
MLMFHVLSATLGSGGALARAPNCQEDYEDCIEDCKIELGMEKERKKLGACVRLCDTKRSDCRDFEHERRAIASPPTEDPAREYGTRPLKEPADDAPAATPRAQPEQPAPASEGPESPSPIEIPVPLTPAAAQPDAQKNPPASVGPSSEGAPAGVDTVPRDGAARPPRRPPDETPRGSGSAAKEEASSSAVEDSDLRDDGRPRSRGSADKPARPRERARRSSEAPPPDRAPTEIQKGDSTGD